MYRWLVLVVVVLSVSACGGQSPRSQESIMATIGAGLGPPTAPPEPTLTAQQRTDMRNVVERAKSMTSSAQEIQVLGQGILANLEWEIKVRAQSDVITAGQRVIELTVFPDVYEPLASRAKEIAVNCAKPVEAIDAISAGKMEINDVAKHHDTIERWCVTEMERMRLQVESLK